LTDHSHNSTRQVGGADAVEPRTGVYHGYVALLVLKRSRKGWDVEMVPRPRTLAWYVVDFGDCPKSPLKWQLCCVASVWGSTSRP